MKMFIVFFFVFSAHAFDIDQRIYDTGVRDFISHQGEGRFDSYLIMDVDFSVIENIRKKLNVKFKRELKHRGEAHITVITPVEYYDVLKDKISMSEIEAIAIDLKLQESQFKVLCLGRGKSGDLETYYLVVSSKDLMAIRQRIQTQYEMRGGKKGAFSASNFYPHITIGFTQRDLHEADGAIKDKKSCISL